MSNLGKKISLDKVMHLARHLLDVQLEHGISTALETRASDIKHFLLNHEGRYYDFDKQELAWLEELSGIAVAYILTHGRSSSLGHHVFYGYDNEPPDTRTPAEIRADRLKEYTPEQIAEFGLDAFDIMVDPEHAGRYTFDMIWNGDIGPDTAYEGDDEDPIHELMQANIEARIEAGRNLEDFEDLKRITYKAVMEMCGDFDEEDLPRLLEIFGLDEFPH